MMSLTQAQRKDGGKMVGKTNKKGGRKCLCDECPFGPAGPVTKFGIDAESHCLVAYEDDGGSLISGFVLPVRVRADAQLEKCSLFRRAKERVPRIAA